MNCIQNVLLVLCLIFIAGFTYAQDDPKVQYLDPEVYEGTFVKKTEPLRDFVAPPFDGDIVKGENLGGENKNPFDLNEKKNENGINLLTLQRILTLRTNLR